MQVNFVINKLKKNLLFISVTLFSVFTSCNLVSATPIKASKISTNSSRIRLQCFTPGGSSRTATLKRSPITLKDVLEEMQRYLDETECLIGRREARKALREERTAEEIAEAIRRLNEHYTFMDGGAYGYISSRDGYEKHHLISSSFCKKHSDIIPPNKAPAISIPIELHRITGSHPLSNLKLKQYGCADADFQKYLADEEAAYNKHFSLRDVCLVGINDLRKKLKIYKQKNNIAVNLKSVNECIDGAYDQSAILSANKNKRLKHTIDKSSNKVVKKLKFNAN